jgi:surfeit locus 1 family protein
MSFLSSLQRPPVFPFILAIAGIAVLCTLGTWQLNRYQWRVAQFEKCETRNTEISKNVIEEAQGSPDGCTISAVGSVQAKPVIPVGYQVKNETMGTQIFGVMRMSDGSGLLVNLGWAKQAPAALPSKTITASGQWITPNGSNAFTPEHAGEHNGEQIRKDSDIWFALDMDEITAHYGLNDIADKVLYASEVTPPVLSPFEPSALRQTYLKPRSHLQYAGFWFTLAMSLSVIFILRFCRK